MLRRSARSTGATDDALANYERTRLAADRSSVCNAPFANLYLRADGAVAPCWLQFHIDSPHWTPEGPGLRAIWEGEQFEALRRRLVRREFEGPCTTCRHAIETGNLPLAAAYDEVPVRGAWPSMLEVELSNHCNLECVMCSGMLSSRIRANREGLPPLEVPYDERLVEQVADFLPHLEELRINGGEPLLQPLVYSLLDQVARDTPELKVTIATNGTVMNSKVERVLEQCRVHFNVSIDSLVPDRYESIRVHARFDVLMRNTQVLIDHAHAHDRLLCIMVNPMRMNWDELPAYVRWCDERDVALWFNTVRYPADVALATLPAEELRHIHKELSRARFPRRALGRQWLFERNRGVFERFRDHQLPAWIDEADARAGSEAATPVSVIQRKPRQT